MADPAPASDPESARAETGVTAIGNTPAELLNVLCRSIARAQANAAHNAVALQQNAHTVSQAATTQGVALLYSIDTAAIVAAFLKKPRKET
jgi:hypothetical protein